jgi:hypothetical protein
MRLIDADNLIAKAKTEAQGMSEPFKTNFAILVEWLVDKTPEAVVRCKECLMHGVCRFERGLGLDGFCSQAERRTDI